MESNLEKEAWRDLATIYTKLGLWTDAEICVNKAKLIEFYSAHSWHTTGRIFPPFYCHSNVNDKSCTSLRNKCLRTYIAYITSIHIHSSNAPYTFAGMLFEAQSQYREALISFSVSLSIEPDYVPSIVSTAEVLMKLGSQSLPIARSFLMNALRLEPTNHEAWLNLGLISKREGSLQQAADFFQAAHDLQLSAPVKSFV